MKKIAILAGMFMLVAGSSFAAAGDTWFGVTVGAAMPTGDAADAVKTGPGATVYGSYGLARNCALGIEAGLYQLGGDVLSDLTWTIMPVTAFTTYTLPMSNPKMRPYVTAGLGLYYLNDKLDLPAPAGHEDSASDFGFDVGLGYDHEMSPNFTLGLLGAYHMIQTEGESTSLYTLGMKLGFGRPRK
jgi:hypothetical protein